MECFVKNMQVPVSSGLARMEQMEQFLPLNAKGHLCNSCRSRDIFGGRG